MSLPNTEVETLGLDVPPGQGHYRAYVGPPGDYDLVAAMTFGLLTVLGLRQHHRLLDIGCGSLRVGRLLIPYLNRGCYTGLEPNAWLIQDGIDREVGQDQIRIKEPHFVIADNGAGLAEDDKRFEYLLAQSIFSHCGVDLLDRWLSEASPLLVDSGALVATYVDGPADTDRSGWIYPECVALSEATVSDTARKYGLQFVPLDWHHPRQRWALFAKPGFDADWFRGRVLSWNDCFSRLDDRRQTIAAT